MTPFYFGIACGALLVAVVAAISSHVFMELADGRLEPF